MRLSRAQSDAGLAYLRGSIDTPFVLGGRQSGLGLDCGGLVAEVGRAAGAEIHDRIVHGHEGHAVLESEFARSLNRISVEEAGELDVLVFAFKSRRHSGVVESPGWMIHACQPTRYVVRRELDPRLMQFCISAFRYRNG